MSSRSRRLAPHDNPRLGGSPKHLIIPALVALAVIAAGLWIIFEAGAGNGGGRAEQASVASQGGVPDFVSLAPERVREAYDFAATHGAELVYIPCYCGCGEHSGHRNVRDCFIKSGSGSAVTYEGHGSQCDICVSIVLDAKAMLARGDTLAQVRTAIDESYRDIGPATDTPLPPGMEE